MLRPKTYLLLTRCIEDGVQLGVNRAYKHTDTPTQEQLHEAIETAVINEICEWFHIDESHLQDNDSVL